MTLSSIAPEFYVFGASLLAIAVFHRHSLKIAAATLALLLLYKIGIQHYPVLDHFIGHDGQGEWKLLLNLLGLLTGFAILSGHFEESRIPWRLSALLPGSWKGGFVLLLMIFIMSAFLDNIASAMIGISIASVVFRGKVHTGYLAAIVAASNAGGAGSVLGDTTTTMMWISGIPAVQVLHAFIAAFAALLFFGIIASHQQHKFQPIQQEEKKNDPVIVSKIILVIIILICAVLGNILIDFPAVGLWAAIIGGSFFISTPWSELKTIWSGSFFLICLVMSASLMPVESLPAASWHTTLVLGFISAFFDNIPLTRLAIEQGGYDWGVLAFAVGFGGSMLWFGSSAGVAVAGKFENAKSVSGWLRHGWHIIIAYVIGFAALLLLLGWNPL
jgi:Na+/H+ antiporter NhaD/arsenite permease-like protein